MNVELKTMLESVLQQSLQPIHSELKHINKRIENIEEEQKNLANKVDNIDKELKDFRTETNTALQDIQGGQRGFRQEMTQRFNEVNLKLSHIESDIAYTFQKTAQNELEINRIKKQ